MVLIVYPWAKCAQYSCCQMRLWLTYVRRSKLTTFIGYVYVSEVITIDCLFKARVLIISYLDLYCSSFLQNECVEVVKDLFGIIADMYFHGWKIGKKSCEKISLMLMHYCGLRSPFDSIRLAVLTASPKRQYLGIFTPTTPAQQGPEKANSQTIPELSQLMWFF